MKALFLAAAAFAAGFGEQSKAIKRGSPPDLVAPMPIHWLRLYPLTPYKANWSYDVEVADFDKALAALQKLGLKPTQPLELFPITKFERQASFRGSFKMAEAADKRLRKLGRVKDVRKRPVAEPVSLAEINDKIDKLSADKNALGDALTKAPHISAAVDEMLGHLLSVKALQETTDSEVLLNVTLILK